MIRKKIVSMFINLFSLFGLSISMQVVDTECSSYIIIDNIGLFQLCMMGFLFSSILMFFIIMDTGEMKNV